MSEKRLVLTMVAGESYCALAQMSLPRMHAYARRVGADFYALRPEMSPYIALEKLRIGEFLGDYDRVLWLDADVLVRPDAPNIFDIVPPHSLAAFDWCSIADENTVYVCHQHMVQVCEEEGLPIPDSRGRYFNCGVQLAPRQARFLYSPRQTRNNHCCAEETVVNVRLHLRPDLPVYPLPEAFNRLYYWHAPRRCEDASWFLHFAAPVGRDRLCDMQAVDQHWLQMFGG